MGASALATPHALLAVRVMGPLPEATAEVVSPWEENTSALLHSNWAQGPVNTKSVTRTKVSPAQVKGTASSARISGGWQAVRPVVSVPPRKRVIESDVQ